MVDVGARVGVPVGMGVSVGSGVSVGAAVCVGSGVLLGSGVGVAAGGVLAPLQPASSTTRMLKMIHRFIIKLLFSNCNHIGGIFQIKTRSTPRGTKNTRLF
jgi:hypothetical protein